VSDPLRIEKLRPDHAVAGFDCGSEELNRFLVRFALINQQAGAAQTYVALSDQRVVGYYALGAGEVVYDEAPGRLSKGLARHPVPMAAGRPQYPWLTFAEGKELTSPATLVGPIGVCAQIRSASSRERASSV